MVKADYDEVWDVDDLRRSIKEVYNSPYRRHGIDGFINFWRGFGHVTANHKILQNTGKYIEGEDSDRYRPIRLIHLREKNTTKEPEIKARIWHFGYAIEREKMLYKLSIHGHRGSMRKEWLEIWENWEPSIKEGLFHPDSLEVWLKIKQFDRTKLPEILHKHPYFNLEMI